MGVVIRNESGEVRASLSKKIVMPSSMEVLEMMAAKRAAISANELGFKNVCFEGDAEGVVRSIREEDSSNAFVGHLVKDFMYIASLFQTYSISHVRRQGNSVAYALAKEARMSFSLSIWMDDVPPNVLNLYPKIFLLNKLSPVRGNSQKRKKEKKKNKSVWCTLELSKDKNNLKGL